MSLNFASDSRGSFYCSYIIIGQWSTGAENERTDASHTHSNLK